MNKDKIPIWLQPGPAEKYYQRHLDEIPLRQAWVEMIRERWGNPHHPELQLFPEVQREDKMVPKTIDCEVKITQFTPPHASQDILIYIHGGGWVIPPSGRHLAWAKRIAHLSNRVVMSVDYRLSPEHPFPAALYDCITVYQYARQQTKGRVFVFGDSAGGNMSAAMALYCQDHHIQAPDKILCLSTFSDQYFETYPSMLELGIGSPYVEMSVIAFIRAFYVPHVKDWKNPYASPIYGNLKSMPPTFVLVGMDDPLRDDNLAFAKKLEEAGVETTLQKFEKMPHSFFTYPDILPEYAERANDALCDFINKDM